MRLLLVLLLLANGAYFLWSQGHLAAWGWAPANPSEPQRLAQQIKPEALKVLSAEEGRRLTAAAEAAAEASKECLVAGPLDEKQAAALRPVLTQTLDEKAWSLEPVTLPGRWVIYMGRYPDVDTLNRKKAELRARRIPFEPVGNPALEPGLSLGSFSSPAAANEELNALSQRGVRTARVQQERADAKGFSLKLPAVDEAIKAKLDPVRDQLAGKTLRPC